jgi:hypothetical protein
MRSAVAIVFVILLVNLSCQSDRRPPNVLSHDQFVSLSCDLLKNAQRMSDWGLDPVNRITFTDSVFSRAGVTRDQYTATIEWYNADVLRWKQVTDDIAREVERRDTLRTPLP